MTVDLASANVMQRPWGVTDLEPWLENREIAGPIGEIWFERPGIPSAPPALLLKLLFTSQPLSIQVHPGDAYARSKGMANGKTEAWYVLGAAPGAAVAVGLGRQLTAQQLRCAVEDGSIADLASWRGVSAGDSVLVPAGTIHAIGAGLVIAEIQQRSDATYRLFDHGRQRDLHIDDGIAVAEAGPAGALPPPIRFTDGRTILTSCPYFVFERIELIADTTWRLDAERETWILAIAGQANVGPINLNLGEAIFAQSDCIEIQAGKLGCVALVAYASARPLPHLLQRSSRPEPQGRWGPVPIDNEPRKRCATPGLVNHTSVDLQKGVWP